MSSQAQVTSAPPPPFLAPSQSTAWTRGKYLSDVDEAHSAAAAQVIKVANFPDAILPNGITMLSHEEKTLLVGDSATGIVYRVDVLTGQVAKVIEDPLTKPTHPVADFGANGLVVRDNSTLFFTNTNQAILAHIPINRDGTPSGPAAVVAAGIETADDFALDRWGTAFIAQNGIDRLGRVKDGVYLQLAGGSVGSELQGPTAVKFGRAKGEGKKVYISTNGGIPQYGTGNITVAGTISSVDVSKYL